MTLGELRTWVNSDNANLYPDDIEVLILGEDRSSYFDAEIPGYIDGTPDDWPAAIYIQVS